MKALLILAVLLFSLPQNGKPEPAEVRITAEDAKPFRIAAEKNEKTQLEIRALSAEIRVAQMRLQELQKQADAERKALQDTLSALGIKAGIPKDKLTEYDLQDDGEGFKLTKRKKD